MFIAIKTDDGRIKGKISFYCKVLHVSRQAFNKFLKAKDTPWKYQALADAMLDICSEDECNDTYGRIRMYQALQLKQPEGVHIPGERTVYRVMAEIGLNHKPKRKPNAITKADREASKSDDLIKRDFAAEKPLEKCMTDMTEIKASDGKLYVSAIFDCYDLAVLGLASITLLSNGLSGPPCGMPTSVRSNIPFAITPALRYLCIKDMTLPSLMVRDNTSISLL